MNYYINIYQINDKNNLVNLTLREHYIIHLLLIRIFENNKNCYIKMLYASNIMTNRIKNNRQYEWQRTEFYNYLKINMTGKPSRAKGKKWSEESKINKSGKNHVMYNKTYEELYGLEKSIELKNKRRESKKGRKNSDETRKKLSERIITKEWRMKISNSNSGKTRTDEMKTKLSKYKLNSNSNPSVDQTIYKFYHIDGKYILCRKIDMKKQYGCTDIHKIILGLRKSCKGWSYKGENSNNNYIEYDIKYDIKISVDINNNIILDYTNRMTMKNISIKYNYTIEEVRLILIKKVRIISLLNIKYWTRNTFVTTFYIIYGKHSCFLMKPYVF
jgi:hypothetical protein